MTRSCLVDAELMEFVPFLGLANLFGPQAREG